MKNKENYEVYLKHIQALSKVASLITQGMYLDELLRLVVNVTAEIMNQWKADAGPTASYFIPRYPLPLYAHPPASTEPRLTVEQAMEVVEPFIDAEAEMEDGARWNWESKHKKYREMIEEIRDRFTKAAKQST